MKKAIRLCLFTFLAAFTVTCSEAMLHEGSDTDYTVRSLSDVDALASALKYEILYSSAQLSVPGTSFYVSNSGNDANNGKSPDNAWATLTRVNETELDSGDAVFFERGGLWRGTLGAQAGVGYSAYGTGEKPKIFGSLRNYSIKEHWHETGTPNVYIYDQALMNDAGLLVFNEGAAHSYKKVIGIDGFSGSSGELKKDLDMYHSIVDHRVYLYSDEGNPADRFASIEICLKGHIVRILGNNVHIDNLCIKYGGSHGIGSGKSGLTVTNCELGWIGGSLQFGDGRPTRYGNAIEVWGGCKGFVIDHCYIYQIYDAGVTHQYKHATLSAPVIHENVTFSHNLIEYCIYSIEYFLNQPNSEGDMMRNILYTKNICRFAGYGWGWQRPNKKAMHIQGWRSRNPAEHFVIEGNIFDRSRDLLISIAARKEPSLPRMTNNTYVQRDGVAWGVYGQMSAPDEYQFNEDIAKRLKEAGVEEHPTILFVQ